MAQKRNYKPKLNAELIETKKEIDFTVSVVIPFHPPSQKRHELNKALDAINNQTVKPCEVIVVEKDQSSYHNRNEGWKKAKGDIIWFVDSDMIPDKDALEQALKVFKSKNPDGVEGNIYGNLSYGNSLGFMTGNIFYKKSILEKIGGFDESFAPRWRGDTDFGWSVLDAGGTILFCEKCKSFHPKLAASIVVMENEQRLRDKHPLLYKKAKKENLLDCKL